MVKSIRIHHVLKFAFTILFFSFSPYASSIQAQLPSIEWVNGFGNNYTNGGSDIEVDNLGNVITCGRFASTVDFERQKKAFKLLLFSN